MMSGAPSGYDLILTSQNLNGSLVRPGVVTGECKIDNNVILRVLSGIGGKIYRSELLAEHGPDETRGRSDDVRLNMRILTAIRPKIYLLPDIVYYWVHASRKSTLVKTLNFEEIARRVTKFEALQEIYPINKRYLAVLKRNLRKTILSDRDVGTAQRSRLLKSLDRIFTFDLKRIVMIAADLSAIGGVPLRVKRTIEKAQGRPVEYVAICSKKPEGMVNALSTAEDHDVILQSLKLWQTHETVVIAPNNLLSKLPKDISAKLQTFPILHMSSAQLAFMIQDSTEISKIEHVLNYKCTKIISLSDADIMFQRQLGIHGQVKGFLPVETRRENSFSTDKNKHLGYVGRIETRAKDTNKLLDIGLATKEANLPPLKIYTTDGKNSPEYTDFLSQVRQLGLEDQFQFVIGETDPEVLYREISLLLLPSKKESFGNVILEAYSFGIPVIGASYAPGPSELIEHGKTGFLLDEYTGDAVVGLVSALTPQSLQSLSNQAFEKHQKYTMEAHLEFLEKTAAAALNEFNGENLLPVLPLLKSFEVPRTGKVTQAAFVSAPAPTPGGKAKATVGKILRRTIGAAKTRKIREEIEQLTRALRRSV